jgi:hypothetical protein
VRTPTSKEVPVALNGKHVLPLIPSVYRRQIRMSEVYRVTKNKNAAVLNACIY